MADEIKDFSGVRNPDLYPQTGTNKPPVNEKPVKAQSISKEELEKDLQESRERAARIKYTSQFRNPSMAVTLPREAYNVQRVQMGDVGKSRYDYGIKENASYETYVNNRALQQSEGIKLLNGILKGVVTAGTTFLSTPIAIGGIINGIWNCFDDDDNTTFLSGIWDNQPMQALQKFNEKMEEVLPNYYYAGDENKFFGGSWGNFLGDKFLKNLGFTVGAFYGGALAAAPKILPKLAAKTAYGLFKTSARTAVNASKWTSAVMGSLVGATTEGAIEAVNNSNEWYKLQSAKLKDQLQSGEITQEQYNGALKKLESDRVRMGNADFLSNIPILMTSNLIQFGKAFAGGYGPNFRLNRILMGTEGKFEQQISKGAAIYAVAKNATTEGLEELNQKIASVISGKAMEQDLNSYLRDGKDYKAQKTLNLYMNNFAQGIMDTVKDPTSWHEFGLGFLTGALGVPTFRSFRGKNGEFQSPIQIQGGIKEGITSFRERKEDTQRLVDYMNQRLEDPKFKAYYKGLIKHVYYNGKLEQALIENDKFSYKNAEFAQMLADVEKFAEAGQLDYLKEQIGELATDSESLADILRAGEAEIETSDGAKTKNIFKDEKGNVMSEQQIKEKIENVKSTTMNLIDAYQNARDDNMIKFPTLDSEGINQVTWLEMQSKNWTERRQQLYNENKELIDTVQREYGVQYVKQDEKNGLYTASNLTGFLRDIANSNSLDETQKQNLIENVLDMQRLTNAIENYGNKIAQYIKDPSKLAEDNLKTQKELEKEWVENEAARFVNRTKNVSSHDELLQILPFIEYQDVFDRVVEKLKEEGNDFVKSDIDNAVDHLNTIQFISDVLEQLKPHMNNFRYNGVRKRLQNIITNSKNSQQLIAGLEQVVADEKNENIKAVLSQIKQNFEANKSREEAIKRQTEQRKKQEEEAKRKAAEQQAAAQKPSPAPQPTPAQENIPSPTGQTQPEPPAPAKEETPTSEEEENKKHEEETIPTIDQSATMSGYVESQYQFPKKRGTYSMTELVLRNTEKTCLDGKGQPVPLGPERVQQFINWGVYDFIDSGELARLNSQHNENLKLHFIASNHKYFNTTTQNRVLIAIEANTPNAININGKRYQIIGEINYKFYVAGSRNMYENVLAKVKEEYKGREDEEFFVSSIEGRIGTIYFGNKVTYGVDPKTNLPVLVSLNKGNVDDLSDNPVFAVRMENGDVIMNHTTEIPEDADIVFDNSNPSVSAGQTYLAYNAPDGRVRFKEIGVRNVGDPEVSMESALMKKIRSLIDTIAGVGNKNEDERLAAMRELQDYINFRDNDVSFVINEDGSTKLLLGQRGETEFEEYTVADANEAFDKVMNKFASLGRKFNISINQLQGDTPSSYIRMLIDAGVVTTNYKKQNNYNAGYTVIALGFEEKGQKSKETNPQPKPTPSVISNTENVRFSFENGTSNVKIMQDGKVFVNNVECKDGLEKRRYLFAEKVLTGKINPVEEGGTLYVENPKMYEFGVRAFNENGTLSFSGFVSVFEVGKELTEINKKKKDKETNKKAEKVNKEGIKKGETLDSFFGTFTQQPSQDDGLIPEDTFTDEGGGETLDSFFGSMMGNPVTEEPKPTKPSKPESEKPAEGQKPEIPKTKPDKKKGKLFNMVSFDRNTEHVNEVVKLLKTVKRSSEVRDFMKNNNLKTDDELIQKLFDINSDKFNAISNADDILAILKCG